MNMFIWNKKTTNLLSVVEYWADRLLVLGILKDSEMLSPSCWRCHTSYGVKNVPIVSGQWFHAESLSNQLLLCQACEVEKPKTKQADVVWKWLKDESSEYYWTIEAMKEYEKQFHTSILQELWNMGIRDGEEVEILVQKVMKDIPKKSLSFNRASLAQAFRVEIEKMRKEAFTNWTGVFQVAS